MSSDHSMAIMVTKMAIAMVVWNFDFEFAVDGQIEPAYEDGFVSIRGSLPLRVSPALRNQAIN